MRPRPRPEGCAASMRFPAQSRPGREGKGRMLRLLLMILACLVAIGAVMASVTPGRHRVAPEIEPAVQIDAEPVRSPDPAAVDDDGARPSASELAPDAGGNSRS